MATIASAPLGSGATLTSADHFIVDDSGTDKRIPATDVARTGAANTFTETQTVAHLVENGINIRAGAVSLANDAFASISSILSGSMTSANGMLFIHNSSNGASAIFSLRGGANAVQEMSDPASVFSVTLGTAASVNVYYSGGYGVQNKSGATANLILFYIGT